MNPRILLLESNTTGTGLLFFKRSLALGLEPVLISDDPSRYPFLRNYVSLKICDRSVRGVLDALDRYNLDAGDQLIAGVWSSSDQGIELAARVAHELGCSHADPAAIALCRDKYAARHRLSAVGLSNIAYALVRDAEAAASFAASVGGPVVVKPRSSTGSIGVKLCATPIEAANHTEALFGDIGDSGQQGVLVEKFVSGPEYSVEIFDAVSIGVTRKLLGPPPAFVEVGHDFPSPGPRSVLAAIVEHAERAIAAAGHLRGPAHVEVRLAAEGPIVIEINPRLAGGLIPELVRRATGIDLITTSIQFACGMPYELCSSHVSAASIRFLCRSTPAAVHRLEGLPDARLAAGIVDAGILDRGLGRAGPITDFRDRLAYVIAEAIAPDEAGSIADHALTLLHGVSTPHSMEADNA